MHLLESEYGKLIAQHGEAETKQMISILDNWYLTKGNKPNTSDYHTMVVCKICKVKFDVIERYWLSRLVAVGIVLDYLNYAHRNVG